MKIYSISLGCPKNRVDTERTLGFMGKFTTVSTPEKADVVFINTCGFIAPAIEESVRTILEHVKLVEDLPKKPLLVVGGCLVGRFGIQSLATDLPEVDVFLESKAVEEWGDLIEKRLYDKGILKKVEKNSSYADLASLPRVLSTAPSYAWLKISEGCRHACSFCTIPSIRGGLKSSSAEALVQEASFLLEQGVKELVLVAQDVTSWGLDIKSSLPKLLEKLLPLPGLLRLRLMYLYPAGLSEELLGFLASAGDIFVPYFDVPLQHAAQNVLSRMGRPFAGRPEEAVERIRKYFPDAALRTSIIVGFPGETEEDFTELCSFVEKTRFHNLGVFTYYAEEGTPAASMPDQVPDSVKDRRRDILMELQGDISEEILAGYLGTTQQILVDAVHDEWPGLHTGRAWFQAPEVDGVTYVSGEGVIPGAMVEADIVETETYDIVALTEPDNEKSSLKK